MTAETKMTLDHLRSNTTALTTQVKDITKKINAAMTKVGRDASNAPAVLRQAANSISRLGELAASLTSAAEGWERQASVDFLQMESRLRDLCKANGWRVDGHWPDFVVEFGIDVHIDEKKHAILVDGRSVPSSERLEADLSASVGQLLPKNFSSSQLLQKLSVAYDSIASGGISQIPLLSLYRELIVQQQSDRFWRDAKAATFAPLSRSQFRAQLSRMLESGQTRTADGRELRLFPPLDPKDAMFIYQPAERRFGFVGRVQFGRE